MKRQRGRGRRPGGGGRSAVEAITSGGHHNPNRPMESNGPDIKVRGPASHIYERYLQLARDAASSGDRVLSENYSQHADHYFRLVRSMQPAQPPQQPQQSASTTITTTATLKAAKRARRDRKRLATAKASNVRAATNNPTSNSRKGSSNKTAIVAATVNSGEAAGVAGARASRVMVSVAKAAGAREKAAKMRSGGDEGGEPVRTTRRASRSRVSAAERRERPQRERDEQSGPEGFSNGPKPAFLAR